MLCNACGLFLKLHGRPRPISLKTDVIKSRNRVKTAQPRKRESIDGQLQPPTVNGFPAAHPDVASAGLNIHHHPPAQSQQIPGAEQGRIPSPNSISRTHTPNLTAQHNPNIAPQHIFDTVSLTDSFASPSLPAFGLRQPSPSGNSINGTTSYDSLQAQNAHLRTRVSELEVINDLFRGRVAELETTEQEARRAESVKLEEVDKVKADLDAANAKVTDLQKRIAEMESQFTPSRKRTRRTTAEETANDDHTVEA